MVTKHFPIWARAFAMLAAIGLSCILLALFLGGLGHTPTRAGTTHIGLMLSPYDGISDMGWGWLSYQGLLRAEGELGVIGTVYTPTNDSDILTVTQQCAADGNDLCIGIGFFYIDPVSNTAPLYPDTHFAILDAWLVQAPEGWRAITFADDQSGYLAGTLAGWMTESDVIGGVGGMEIPPVVEYMEGYRHGALCANPGVSVPLTYTGSFTDTALGSQVALELMAQGADVIFAAAGGTGTGALLTATQAGAWGIGVDTDQYLSVFSDGALEGSERMLTSAMIRLDNAVFASIQDETLGTFTNGTVEFNMANEGVGLAPFHEAEPAIPLAARNDLARVEFSLRNGTIDVYGACPGYTYLPLVIKEVKDYSRMGHLEGDFSAVDIAGEQAYVLSYEGLHVIDVSNSMLPSEVGAYLDLPDGAQSLFAVDDYAYTVWTDYGYYTEGGLYVMDISDPVAPGLANFYDLIDVYYPPLHAYVDEPYAYVVRGMSASPHIYLGDIQILDISQPLSITATGGITTAVRDVFVREDTLYTAWFVVYYGGLSNSGVALYDITDRANPQILGSHLVTTSPYGPYVMGVTAVEGNLYATLSTSETIVLDVSNPYTPTVVFTITAPAKDNYISGNELYLYGGDAIYVYDLVNPDQPLLDHTYPISEVADLRADEWHIFAVSPSGLYILNR